MNFECRLYPFLIGKEGKMGKAIASLLQEHNSLPCNNLDKADVVIDFSAPEALIPHIPKCIEHHIPLVSGTTGLSDENFLALKKASLEIPIFYAPNFSFGVYYFKKALQKTCETLPVLSARLIETHHIHKKDKPSGTAKALLQILEEQKIPTDITSIRKEEQVGKHTLELSLQHETITITHEACDRKVFAQGALLAAQFLKRQPPGLYSMDDLLLHSV